MARYELYGEDGDAEREWCPRCGDVLLAEHEDRQHCGKCGFTEWK